MRVRGREKRRERRGRAAYTREREGEMREPRKNAAGFGNVHTCMSHQCVGIVVSSVGQRTDQDKGMVVMGG